MKKILGLLVFLAAATAFGQQGGYGTPVQNLAGRMDGTDQVGYTTILTAGTAGISNAILNFVSGVTCVAGPGGRADCTGTGGGGGAPTTASYITSVSEAGLSNEFALGGLASGLLLNTTTTGIPTIYPGNTCTNQFARSDTTSGVWTCATVGTNDLAAAGVTFAKLQNGGALSLWGRSANSSGVIADIQATAASDCAYREFSSAIGCGTLATAAYANNSITVAKFQQMALNTVLGNFTSGTANATAFTMPTCADSAGNHLNYVNGTGITCGTTSSGGSAHNLLSATHSDTAVASPVRGSVIVGNATPAWATTTIGAAGTYIGSDGTDTKPINPFLDTQNSWINEEWYGNGTGPAWSFSNTATGTVGNIVAPNNSPAHPGVIDMSVAAVADQVAYNLYQSTNTQNMDITGGAMVLKMAVNIPLISDGVQNFTWRCGFCDQKNADCQGGLYFEHNIATDATHWIIKSANGSGTRTTTVTTATITNGNWDRLEIDVNAAGTSVDFFINGSNVGTITTNLPTTATGMGHLPGQLIKTLGATARHVLEDYYYFYQRLTAVR